LPFWGYFFNEPTKSSLIGEKLPNLVSLFEILSLAHNNCSYLMLYKSLASYASSPVFFLLTYHFDANKGKSYKHFPVVNLQLQQNKQPR
jgi:hypothetical protein